MDEHQSQHDAPAVAAEEFARRIRDGRQLSEQALANHERQFAALEQQLQERLDSATRAAEQLRSAEDESTQQEKGRLSEWANELETQKAALIAEREKLDAAKETYYQEAGDTEAIRQRLEAQVARYESDQADLKAAQSKLEDQRERIARKFRDQREEHWKEVEEMRQRLQAGRDEAVAERDARLDEEERKSKDLTARVKDLRSQLHDANAKTEEFERKLRAAQESADAGGDQTEEIGELQAELSTAKGQCRELESRIESANSHNVELESQCEQLRRQIAELESLAAEGGSAAELNETTKQLTAERDELAERVSELQQRLINASTGEASDEITEDLQQRLEMALDDLRELGDENKRLKQQAAAGGGGANLTAGALDWEEQKRRLLAELEDEGGDLDDDQRVEIEKLIRDTEGAVAEKDREIAELKSMLDQQSTQVGDMVVGAQALAEMFDQDQVIREERERTEQLRSEWQEKLGKAEVELSMERAKLARERTELEEKMRNLETELSKQDRASSASVSDEDDKPDKRRWLTRLGLKDD